MILPLILAVQLQAVPRINLAVSEFAAQYGAVRAMAEAHETPASPGLKAAVADLEAIEKTFPAKIRTRAGATLDAATIGQSRVTGLYWATLDALTYSAGSADRLGEIADVMPKIGGELDTATATQTIAKALAESKAEFDADLWPKEQKEAKDCIGSFEKIPAEKREAALRFIMRTAGIAAGPKQIDLLVVPRMAGKEGMTVRTPSGLLIIVGVGKYRGTDFAELVLHESTHVLDAFAGSESLFGKLRVALKAAGSSPFELEEGPHTLMFLIAAEAVRRNIAPKHKDIGATFGIYARGLDPIRKVEQPILNKLIAGEIQPDEAVKSIVAGIRGG